MGKGRKNKKGGVIEGKELEEYLNSKPSVADLSGGRVEAQLRCNLLPRKHLHLHMANDKKRIQEEEKEK